MDNNLIGMLKRHEGFRAIPYKCSAGKLTIGYGRNLEATGLSEEEAMLLLVHDVEKAISDTENVFLDFSSYSQNRKNALIDMIFNLGRTRFLGFHKMIHAILKRDWEEAAREAENSTWHKQVGNRALEIEELLRKG